MNRRKRGPITVAIGLHLAVSTACMCESGAPAAAAAVPVGLPSNPALALPPSPSAIPAPADVATAPADAMETSSGLKSKVLQPGTGTEHPRDQDEVRVNYALWKTTGEMFDRSAQPFTTLTNKMFPGWAEGVKLMVVGEKRRLWVPAKLAYGETPGDGLPAGDVTVDVELLELVRLGDAPEVPHDLKKPPADAKKTASGLVYKVLTPGTGRSPGPTDAVLVRYAGFTEDGKVFDNNIARGRPTTMRVNQVVRGWAEGLMLMKEGEKAQFWLPPELGYGSSSNPGTPSGPLVFVTELVKLKDSPAAAAR
jgi:FKBP-type peptidyl-prolyl cis-trans isomerase